MYINLQNYQQSTATVISIAFKMFKSVKIEMIGLFSLLFIFAFLFF